MEHVPDRPLDPPIDTLYDDDAMSCEAKGHKVRCISSRKIVKYVWKCHYVCDTCGMRKKRRMLGEI